MNKKGVFFTIISIILVSGLIFFYISGNRYTLTEKSRVVQTRILTMDSFIGDIEHDIERGLFISSMRSLIGMSEYLTENGSYFTNFSKSFNEIMLNGTIEGNQLNITKESHFGNWTDKVSSIGSKLGIEVSLQNLSIETFQDNPWNVKIRARGNLQLVDITQTASWDRDLNVTTNLDITEFEDPLYLVSSAGKFTNTIIRSNITDFVSGSNASNLIEHVNRSWYRASTLAPSFLMRYEGNLSASPFGIESIVHIENIQVIAPELYYSGKSTVDYVYFNAGNPANCEVNETKNVLAWFRLENAHLSEYEAHCS